MIINQDDQKNQVVIALNKYSGKTFWEHSFDIVQGTPLDFTITSATPVIWKDNVIIHRTFDLSSLNLNDGSLLWSMNLVTEGISTPLILNDTIFVNGYFITGDSRFYDLLPDFDSMIQQYDMNRDKLVNYSEIPAKWVFYRRIEQNLIQNLNWNDTIITMRGWARDFDLNKNKALDKGEWSNLMKSQSDFALEHGTVAIKLNGSGESYKPVIIWKEKEFVSEVPSLLDINHRVYMITNGGILSCLEAGTGKLIFRERLKAPGGYFASPLYAGGNIYFASYNGRITVIRPGDKLNIVAQSDLHEKIGASPVALGKMLYIRTDSGLYAFKKFDHSF